MSGIFCYNYILLCTHCGLLISIENSYGGGDKVVGPRITNTGTKVLIVRMGSSSMNVAVNQTRTLDCLPGVPTQLVKAGDDYDPSQSWDVEEMEAKMTTIATITYTSNALFSVAAGDTLAGATCSFQVPMVDHNAA